MSGYPPGVTGREYAIAGPDREGEAERTCGATDVTVYTMSRHHADALERLMRNADLKALTGPETISLRMIGSDVEETEIEECPFEGTVGVQWYANFETWVCPVCRTQHDNEVEFEQDPDEGRDEA